MKNTKGTKKNFNIPDFTHVIFVVLKKDVFREPNNNIGVYFVSEEEYTKLEIELSLLSYSPISDIKNKYDELGKLTREHEEPKAYRSFAPYAWSEALDIKRPPSVFKPKGLNDYQGLLFNMYCEMLQCVRKAALYKNENNPGAYSRRSWVTYTHKKYYKKHFGIDPELNADQYRQTVYMVSKLPIGVKTRNKRKMIENMKTYFSDTLTEIEMFLGGLDEY